MSHKAQMKVQGLKYYSNLSSKQKDRLIGFVRIVINGLTELPKGLASDILKSRDLEFIIIENEKIDLLLKGQKTFFSKEANTYIPLNIKDFHKNN